MNRMAAQDEKKPADDARGDAPKRSESGRAKAYLDLWEQHVVQTALHGPVSSWRQTRS